MSAEREYDPDTGDYLLTAADVAARGGIRVATLQAASRRDDTTTGGKYPRATVNLAGKLRYRSSVVEAWLAARQVSTDA